MIFGRKIGRRFLFIRYRIGKYPNTAPSSFCCFLVLPCVPISPLTINGLRPAAVGKEVAALYLGSKKLLERMIWTTRHCPADPWLELVNNAEGDPKQKTLIGTASLEAAAARYAAGERPAQIGSVHPVEVVVDGRKFLIGPAPLMARLKVLKAN